MHLADIYVSYKIQEKEEYRWSYMTTKQLEIRLNKITHSEKLAAFYYQAKLINDIYLMNKALDRYENLTGEKAPIVISEKKFKQVEKYIKEVKTIEEIKKKDEPKEYKRAIIY